MGTLHLAVNVLDVLQQSCKLTLEAQPLPYSLSTRYSRQSTEGDTHDGRLVGEGVRDDDPDVDARRTQGFI